MPAWAFGCTLGLLALPFSLGQTAQTASSDNNASDPHWSADWSGQLRGQSTTPSEGAAYGLCQQAYALYSNVFADTSIHELNQTAQALGCTSAGLLTWGTSFDWERDLTTLKSHANAATNQQAAQISSLASMPAIYHYNQTGGDINSNNLLSAWIGTSASSQQNDTSSKYVLNIVLSSSGNTLPAGNRSALLSSLGTSWNVYEAADDKLTTVTLVSERVMVDVSADFYELFNATVTALNIPSSLYLASFGGGVELYSGSGSYNVSSFGAGYYTGPAASCAQVDASLKSASRLCGSQDDSSGAISHRLGLPLLLAFSTAIFAALSI
ncbi:glycoside hydrolase family 12 protein [Mixia osmundae IAM 14324]|uniref:Uncharacterized protein n=1 Tax=Mixia osmundae (strain CBS 9802 / IAM 14324 / JCM 22182 / KY 12970) TaxID=764103 RepID=G7E803_MIXOS|nr:glycoside hydrolase family 12 protein [Mixia osmundae IAM 14324]KEI38562.1 glycoside hydrolase family 12 protein [Mixia osmundae IAM 14324]GAA98963.1 hypothetical protein E5Q_05651 [Mixia osmundae IAM 14324]